MTAVTQARKLGHAMLGRDPDVDCDCGGGWWWQHGELVLAVHDTNCERADMPPRPEDVTRP